MLSDPAPGLMAARGSPLSIRKTVFIVQVFTLGAEAPAPHTGAKAAAFSAETGGGDRDEILVRARNGDAAAFARLIRLHQGMVFSVALHALRSRAAAEDLAQEVFL